MENEVIKSLTDTELMRNYLKCVRESDMHNLENILLHFKLTTEISMRYESLLNSVGRKIIFS